jgi:hypothetical protein
MFKGFLLAGAILLLPALEQAEFSSAQDKPPVTPAEFRSAGSFSGGVLTAGVRLDGIRFGSHDGYTRMVLDFSAQRGAPAEAVLPDGGLALHPRYEVAYAQYPYRLCLKFLGVGFDGSASVQSRPALPFSVVTGADSRIVELQIFLSGPSRFKVIEIDGPAKLAIDVQPDPAQSVPEVFCVQITDARTPEDAYGLLRTAGWPDGALPSAIVLGDKVVLEYAYTDRAGAVSMQARLRDLGYSSLINERRGDQLPQV